MMQNYDPRHYHFERNTQARPYEFKPERNLRLWYGYAAIGALLLALLVWFI